jgi:radical SAM modification target selenobiotic family peptide
MKAKGGLAFKEVNMDSDQLKKILAGLCLASLISGSALMVSGCAQKASS